MLVTSNMRCYACMSLGGWHSWVLVISIILAEQERVTSFAPNKYRIKTQSLVATPAPNAKRKPSTALLFALYVRNVLISMYV